MNPSTSPMAFGAYMYGSFRAVPYNVHRDALMHCAAVNRVRMDEPSPVRTIVRIVANGLAHKQTYTADAYTPNASSQKLPYENNPPPPNRPPAMPLPIAPLDTNPNSDHTPNVAAVD